MTSPGFDPGRRATLLKYAAAEVPHATLEINRTCNLRCRCCYNIDRGWVKPLDEIERDLERAMMLRRLQTVTILGGEPTLHPELPRIVALVKGRGVHTQLLTNGLRFLDADGPALLRALKAAGIDKIILHVDNGQTHVHADIEAARERLFTLMESECVQFALSVTVYNEDRGRLAAIDRRYARFRFYDGILAVLARDVEDAAAQTVELGGESEALKTDAGLEPTAYVPSSLSDAEARWFIYFFLVDAGGTRFYPFSPRLDRAFRRVFRYATGRHFFASNYGPAALRAVLGPLVLFEALTSPGRIPALAELFRKAGSPANLRLHFIAIQVPPDRGPDGEVAVICRGCPDATVRDGRLVPVCIADLVSPRVPSPGPVLACPAF